MTFSRAVLVLALAPFLSISATLISQSREANANAAFFPPSIEVDDSDSTLLAGSALLEAAVNPDPTIAAESRLKSLISPQRFEVTDFFAAMTISNADFSIVAAEARTNLVVSFEVTDPETWFLNLSFNNAYDGIFDNGGASAMLSLTGPGTVFSYFNDDLEPPLTASRKLLLYTWAVSA